jgi:hypothetical protein
MNEAAYRRYAVPIVLLAIIAGLYLWMHPLSQRLLTPPPSGFVVVTMVTVMGVSPATCWRRTFRRAWCGA